MPKVREHSQKHVFVSFNEESEWVEFKLRFNSGSKTVKPTKFEAWRVWRTLGAPELFAGTRGSFASPREAEAYLVDQVAAGGGKVHQHSVHLVSRLAVHHGYNCA